VDISVILPCGTIHREEKDDENEEDSEEDDEKEEGLITTPPFSRIDNISFKEEIFPSKK
jgi:hypothetical protein